MSSAFMSPDELREHLQKKSSEYVGSDDLKEANRRFRVLHEWRYSDE